MKFWRLAPRHDTLWWCIEGKDPWQPHRNRAFGFVVRARDEEEARFLAHQNAGEENEALDGVSPWLDAAYSTCDELRDAGSPEVLLVNFRY